MTGLPYSPEADGLMPLPDARAVLEEYVLRAQRGIRDFDEYKKVAAEVPLALNSLVVLHGAERLAQPNEKPIISRSMGNFGGSLAMERVRTRDYIAVRVEQTRYIGSITNWRAVSFRDNDIAAGWTAKSKANLVEPLYVRHGITSPHLIERFGRISGPLIGAILNATAPRRRR